MTKPMLRYDKMVETALRSVVRDALTQAAEHGLPGAHHFYVTFKTEFPGVTLPGFLKAQYPAEMTIVLEHQFWGLEVDDDEFGVTLSFHGQQQRVIVPLAAITAFTDPSVKFGLEFRSETAPGEPETGGGDAETPKPAEDPAVPERAGEVVRLDAFRKK